MTTAKPAAQQLVALCKEKNISDVVISPGSRNAPLIIGFTGDSFFNCLNIPDERAAAFIALGMAKATGKPAVLACTSGSAVLNYYPAVAEAFYQNIPLIVLSADRPPEWIDQADGQTIRQHKVLEQHTVFSDSLQSEPQDRDTLIYNNFLINKALETALRINPGPVHLNVPFREPLYDQTDEIPPDRVRNISFTAAESALTNETIQELQSEWNDSPRIMVLAGMNDPDSALTKKMTELAQNGVIVFTETVSNLHHPLFFPCIDRLINTTDEALLQRLQPDLLITTGTAVVSKMIKKLLRNFDIKSHWHVHESDFMLDTYQKLTRHIPVKPAALFNTLELSPRKNDYREFWQSQEDETVKAHKAFAADVQWSDFKVFELLSRHITSGIVHLANSSPVRYAQLFNQTGDVEFYSNRGTSGIDGSISTAAGHALRTDKTVWAVTGDLSFLYDSNALFHNHLPHNLRIIVINNGGGNIFRILPGPRTTEALEQHFESSHDFGAKGVAQNFGVHYLAAQNETELKQHLNTLLTTGSGPALLEVFTPQTQNDAVLKAYFNHLKARKTNNS